MNHKRQSTEPKRVRTRSDMAQTVSKQYFPDQPQTASSGVPESTGCDQRGIEPFGPAADLAA
jgi:hypothetical protein